MSDGSPFSEGHLLGLLRDRHRRYALAALNDVSRPVSVTQLAREVYLLDTGGDLSDQPEVSEERVADLEVKLRHVDLPKLRDASLVAYDDTEVKLRNWVRFEKPDAWLLGNVVGELIRRTTDEHEE